MICDENILQYYLLVDKDATWVVAQLQSSDDRVRLIIPPYLAWEEEATLKGRATLPLSN
jgi:Flp pilus assembly CpaF family ATPase